MYVYYFVIFHSLVGAFAGLFYSYRLITYTFTDFKKILGKKVTWELNDPMMNLGDVVLYNESYNLMIVMVSEKIWNIFNKAVNIGKKTKTDIETQREIIINVFEELVDKKWKS